MKYLLILITLLSTIVAGVAQGGSTRVLYPKPDTAAQEISPEPSETSSRVLYPEPAEESVLNEETEATPEPQPEATSQPEEGASESWPEPEASSKSNYDEPYTYTTHRRPRRNRSRTLLGDRGRCCGGYGAFSMNVGEVGDQSAILLGGRGAWVMGGGFGIGFGGYALVNDVIFDDITPGEDLQLEMAYGGLYLEPMVATRSPVHISFPVLLGAGGAIYTDNSFRRNDNFDWDRDVVDSDVFFVFEPGAYLEFHIVRFFRVGLGAQYRIIGDLDLLDTGGNDLNGWTAGLTLKFGNY